MRVMLVVNPSASSVTTSRRRAATVVLEECCELEVEATRHRDHATVLARRAVETGASAVVVLGGDGTLNEVAAALVGTDCALGALPGGSTNVLARTIGLPDDVVDAARCVGEAIPANSTRTVSMGSANGRPFVLHTGIGWDAALVALTERLPIAKRWTGQLPFVAAGLRTFTGAYDRRRPHFDLEVGFGPDDGAPDELIEGCYFALALNSDPYTWLGPRPFRVSPAADLQSPLSVVALTSMKVSDLAPAMFDALRDDSGISAGDHVVVRTGVTRATATRLTTMPFQVDGDHLGDADRIDIAHHPRALDLVVPVGATATPGHDGRPPGRW